MKIMSLISPALVSLMTLASANADVGHGYQTLSEYGTKRAYLNQCEGSASLSETYVGGERLPLLQMRNIKNCSRITIDGVESRQKIERHGSSGTADVIIYEKPGVNVHTVTLSSGSRQTSDTIQVISFGNDRSHGGYEHQGQGGGSANIVLNFGPFASEIGSEKYATLRDCGGRMTARIQDGDTLTLIFSNVDNCSKFDILSAEGRSVNYPQKSLQRTRRGEFAGSFTIPQRYIKYGNNSVKVVLKSNSGAHDEVVLIRFSNY